MAAMSTVPSLTDGVVLLDGHTDADVASHVNGEDDETARRFGWWPNRSTADSVRRTYREWDRAWASGGSPRAFAVREAHTGALVGGCELRIQQDGSGHVSYWTNSTFRRRGYSTRALQLLYGYAESIGVSCLESHVAMGNVASRAVSERAGFTVHETFTEDDGTEMIRYVRAVPG